MKISQFDANEATTLQALSAATSAATSADKAAVDAKTAHDTAYAAEAAALKKTGIYVKANADGSYTLKSSPDGVNINTVQGVGDNFDVPADPTPTTPPATPPAA